jgi:hypothetical protein
MVAVTGAFALPEESYLRKSVINGLHETLTLWDIPALGEKNEIGPS